MRMRILAAMVLFPSLTLAGKLSFDTRIDAQNQEYDAAARTAGLGTSNFRYLLKVARLDYLNNLNEKTNFRGRLVLNTNQGTVNKRDSINNTVDLFFVNHRLNDQFDLTMGKFSSDMGATEQQYPSADVYLQSAANAGFPSELNTSSKNLFSLKKGTSLSGSSWTWANSGIVKYYTGAKLNYKFDEQEFSLHSANLSDDDNTSGTFSQTRTTTGAVYKGTFADKKIRPILSYHEAFLPTAPSANLSAKATYIGVGLKLEIQTHTFDLDYLNNNFKEKTLLSNGNHEDDNIRSINFGWSMPYEDYLIKLKTEQSEIVLANEKVFDISACGAALEWKPKKEDTFRFHLAYNHKSYLPVSGETQILQEIIFGTRINADFLK